MIGTSGLLPMALFYVYIGTTMSTIEEAVAGTRSLSTAEIVVTTISLVVALCGIIVISIIVKRTLKKEIEVIKQTTPQLD
jgi:hypothetical protein